MVFLLCSYLGPIIMNIPSNHFCLMDCGLIKEIVLFCEHLVSEQESILHGVEKVSGGEAYCQ